MKRTPRPWRYRRCPFCLVVLPAGTFRCLDVGEHWRGPQARRACPRCGIVGSTRLFQVVRERHCDSIPVSVARDTHDRYAVPQAEQLSFLPAIP